MDLDEPKIIKYEEILVPDPEKEPGVSYIFISTFDYILNSPTLTFVSL